MPELDSHLKELIFAVLEEREKASMATARTLEIRLEKLNELRKEVTDDRASFVKREVYDQMHEGLTQRLNRLEAGYSRIMGGIAVLVLIAGVLGAVVGSLMSHILK